MCLVLLIYLSISGSRVGKPARSQLALESLGVDEVWRQWRWFPALWTYCFCFAVLEIYLDMLMSTFHLQH